MNPCIALRLNVRPRWRLSGDLLYILSYALLAIVALLPRALDLGSFLTEDEANFWLSRSAPCRRAISPPPRSQTIRV